MTKAKQMNMWAKLTDRLWKKVVLGFVLIVFGAWFVLGIFTGFSTSPRYELNKRAFQKLGHPDGWQLVSSKPYTKDVYFLCNADQECASFNAEFSIPNLKAQDVSEAALAYYALKNYSNSTQNNCSTDVSRTMYCTAYLHDNRRHFLKLEIRTDGGENAMIHVTFKKS